MVDAGTKGGGPDNTMTGGATGDGDTDPPATTGDGTDGPPPSGDGDTTPVGDGTDGTTDGTDGTTDGTDGTTDGTDGTPDAGTTEPDAGTVTPQCTQDNSPLASQAAGCDGGRTLFGFVRDMTTDQGIPGVTIVEDTCPANQATSDFDGSFTITVPDSGVAFVRMHLDGSYEPGLSEFFSVDTLPDSLSLYMVPATSVDSYRGSCGEPVLVAKAFDVNGSTPVSGVTFSDLVGADVQYADGSLSTLGSGPTSDAGIAIISGDALVTPASDDVSAAHDTCTQNGQDSFPFELGYVTAALIPMTCN